jgi:broad specificity phosphatase PhoE
VPVRLLHVSQPIEAGVPRVVATLVADQVARGYDVHVACPDGEAGLAVTARALPALLKIVEDNCEKRILVVSHKATIRLLLSSLLGFDPRKYRERLDQSPCALNILDFRDLAHARLTLFNDTSHYEGAIPEVPHDRLSRTWSGKEPMP